MSPVWECPSHPGQPREDCGYCGRAIAEAEARESGLWAVDEADRAADRYERWLREVAP